jgi:hypothetical protein
MDSIKAKHIRQDLQDHLDMGPSAKERYLVVGEKYPLNPVNPACPMRSFCPISSGSITRN